MIKRLRKIIPGLYRGGAPTPKDVIRLKELLGINKIVSLDKATGDRIDRVCKMLGIRHVKMYIEDTSRKTLYHVLSQDLKKLLLDGGPTFFHCHEGKDRTGLIAALFECKYLGMKPEDAIAQAKSLGFGVGLPPNVVQLYEKLIRSCKPSRDKDVNNTDIVNNERDTTGDNRDSFLDESRRGSFAPYLDHTRQDPMDAVYVYINDQSPTRENYHQTWEEPIKRYKDEAQTIPQVGTYNNDAGARGFGPTENYSGFFYD